MNDWMWIRRSRGAGGSGWPQRALGGVLGVLLILVAFTFGVLMLGLVAVAALLLAVRVWWWRRGLRQSRTQSPVIIEGEYRVLETPQAGNKDA